MILSFHRMLTQLPFLEWLLSFAWRALRRSHPLLKVVHCSMFLHHHYPLHQQPIMYMIEVIIQRSIESVPFGIIITYDELPTHYACDHFWSKPYVCVGWRLTSPNFTTTTLNNMHKQRSFFYLLKQLPILHRVIANGNVGLWVIVRILLGIWMNRIELMTFGSWVLTSNDFTGRV